MIHLLWISLAVPVAIHLAHRRKARQVPFSTLRFLRMVDRRVARSHRLKELLLLAVRVLLLAALVGALYHPVLRSALWRGKDVPTAAVLVLDDTYSMRVASGGRTRHARGRRALLAVLDGLRRGDAAALLRFPHAGSSEAALSTDLERLREQVRRAEPGWGAASAAPALRRARELLEGTNLPRRELYLVSDFQGRSWRPALEEFRDAFSDLPVHLVDTGGPAERNLALTETRLGFNLQAVGAASEVFCTVRNTGSANASAEVSLLVDGRKVAGSRARVAAGGVRTVPFRHAFRRTGRVGAEVRVEADQLEADDARYFVASVEEKVPVLLVNGDPSGVPYRNETFFLEQALRAAAEGGPADSPIRTATVPPSELAERRLRDYACVVLADVARLPETLADRLRRYVRGGGGLVVFPGDRFVAESWNAALGTDVLPGAPTGPRGSEEGVALRWFDRSHPAFAGLQDIRLPRARVRRYFALEPSSEATILAETEAGPLLLERRVGAGTVLMSATAADMEWSDLPARPFFLPLLHQVVYYVGRRGRREGGLTVGEPLVAELPPSSEAREIEVHAPGEADEPLRTVSVEAGRAGAVTLLEGADRPGLYRAVWGGDGARRSRPFAVNVPAAESDLEALPAGEVGQALAGRSARTVEDPEGLAEDLRRRREGLPLWNYLFAAALALAVLECWVGNVWLKR
ncbi:MAG: BatA domain-containing protein [Planctomycetota bacterium]